MRGPDLRIGQWVREGYIHPKPFKDRCLLVLRACPADIKEEMRKINEQMSFHFYIFEDEISPEDLVFLDE